MSTDRLIVRKKPEILFTIITLVEHNSHAAVQFFATRIMCFSLMRNCTRNVYNVFAAINQLLERVV